METNLGIPEIGNRGFTLIPYNHDFKIRTLLGPKRGTVKLHPQKGIHLNYLDYWSESFKDPTLWGTQVEVKFDPSNASLAYAYVNKKWVTCISAHANIFRNWTASSMAMATELYRATKKASGIQNSIDAIELAAFMDEAAKDEAIMLQRIKERALKSSLGDQTESPEEDVQTGDVTQDSIDSKNSILNWDADEEDTININTIEE